MIHFTINRLTSYILQINCPLRVISSIGRAARLQRAGQWFDPTITQSFVVQPRFYQ